MHHDDKGLTKFSEWEEKYTDFNQLDWGVCDDAFQACNKSKVKELPWYDIPGKTWTMFVGNVLSSAVIEGSADFFGKLDENGELSSVKNYKCIKKGEGLCTYD